MPTPDSDPVSEFSLAAAFAADLESAPADDRVYRVALQLYDSARVATIADRADCSPDTARRHLNRLVNLGVLEQVGDAPATYRRNDSYFEWRKRSRLEHLSPSHLKERLKELIAREQDFQDRYDAAHPGEVDALAHADYDQIEEVWMDLSEWETVRHRIRRLEDVRQQRTSDSESLSESEAA